MKKEKKIDRLALVSEYLSSDISYRALGEKYGINYRQIHSWVKAAQSGQPCELTSPAPVASNKEEQESTATEIAYLRTELRKSELHKAVLEEMLKLSEELTGIDLRKKFGTKRS
jgi:transposase-like protein